VRGRTEEAIAGFDAVIAADPQNPAPYVGRGMIHLERGEADLAIADDDAALGIAPQDSFARANRAMAAFYLGKFEDAAKDYAIVQAGDPGDAGFLLWLHIARAGGHGTMRVSTTPPPSTPRTGRAGRRLFRGRATAAQVEAAAAIGSKAERCSGLRCRVLSRRGCAHPGAKARETRASRRGCRTVRCGARFASI
jgi:tetratricopeptide (TPR) repeat protein